MAIGGELDLRHNRIASLPESIGTMKIGGYLYLSGNLWIGKLAKSHCRKTVEISSTKGHTNVVECTTSSMLADYLTKYGQEHPG